MNDFLVLFGLSQAYGETWVQVPHPRSVVVEAYYTICPDPVQLVEEEFDDSIAANVVVLNRLAVDKAHQGRGVGRSILLRIIDQTIDAANKYNIDALLLDALDDEVRDWYLGLAFGFQPITPNSRRLLLPVAAMRLLRKP